MKRLLFICSLLLPIVGFTQPIDTTIYFSSGLLHIDNEGKDYRFEKKSDWDNFRKYYPDSCATIHPLIEMISRREARHLQNKFIALETLNDTSLIVPWHSIKDEMGHLFGRPNSLSAYRVMERCKACNSRLILCELTVPYQLKKINQLGFNTPGPLLLFCDECNMQIAIVSRDEFWRGKTFVSPLPKRLIGFWESRSSRPLFGVCGRSCRRILEISEDGIMRIWSESTYWNKYNFEPEAMWINSSLGSAPVEYIFTEQKKIYTYDENKISIGQIVSNSKWELVIKDGGYIDISSSLPDFTLSDMFFNRTMKYKKIKPPYSVFPNIPIGRFPDKNSLKDPRFWNLIDDVLVLTDDRLSDEVNGILDSLKIRVHYAPLMKDSTVVNEDILLWALDIIHRAEKSGKQVLVLCNSNSNCNSKLLGECYHFQKTGKFLDQGQITLFNNQRITGSVIQYYCKVGILPPLENMRELLKVQKHR